ncbi:MAG: ABC transporter ATP-binding protein [Clostridia bacterium]|nr:ABC transporter ATP-binding protein [Clostridia bacterium]
MGIILKNLQKKYESQGKTVTALDGVNLEFGDGELVAIIGESGSGKTTLLNAMCGIDRPDSGNILIDGNDIVGMSADGLCRLRRSKIGVIYQFYNLIPELNVKDNVTLPLELDNRHIEGERISQVLSSVGLADRELSFPSALSGGQQQRVAIARAILQQPSIILADEPTGNLDERNGEEILSLLCRLNEEYGTTVIIVTHSRAVADRARRLIELKNGKIITDRVVQ